MEGLYRQNKYIMCLSRPAFSQEIKYGQWLHLRSRESSSGKPYRREKLSIEVTPCGYIYLFIFKKPVYTKDQIRIYNIF